jgi:hypothetical protein
MVLGRRAFLTLPAVAVTLPRLRAGSMLQAKLQSEGAEFYEWRLFPKFGAGRVVGVDLDRGRQLNLLSFSREGQLARIPVDIPSTREIIVLDFAISDSGDLAVVGGVDGEDQTGAYVLRIGRSGEHMLLRTAPYLPVAVGFSPDGNLWTAGHLSGTGRSRTHQLRRFDREGNAIIAVPNLTTSGHSLNTSLIASSEDRVGLRTHSSEYSEFSIDGKELGRWDLPNKGRLTGLAMDRRGRVVVGQSVDKGTQRLLVLDREAGKWSPVELVSGAPRWCRPIGFDGDVLVTTDGKRQRRYLLS